MELTQRYRLVILVIAMIAATALMASQQSAVAKKEAPFAALQPVQFTGSLTIHDGTLANRKTFFFTVPI